MKLEKISLVLCQNYDYFHRLEARENVQNLKKKQVNFFFLPGSRGYHLISFFISWVTNYAHNRSTIASLKLQIYKLTQTFRAKI